MSSLRDDIARIIAVPTGDEPDEQANDILALIAEAMLNSDTRKRCVAAFGEPLEGEDMEWYEEVLMPITYGTVDTVLTAAAAGITGAGQEGGEGVFNCPNCEGTGLYDDCTCSVCEGEGELTQRQWDGT